MVENSKIGLKMPASESFILKLIKNRKVSSLGDFFTTSLSPVRENYFTEVSRFGDMSPKEENFTQASKNSPKRETFAYIPSCPYKWFLIKKGVGQVREVRSSF